MLFTSRLGPYHDCGRQCKIATLIFNLIYRSWKVKREKGGKDIGGAAFRLFLFYLSLASLPFKYESLAVSQFQNV